MRDGDEPQPVLPGTSQQVHVGRPRLQLPAVRRAGCLLDGTARSEGPDSEPAPTDLGNLFWGAWPMGRRKWDSYARRPGALRAIVEYVLSHHANAGRQATFDPALSGQW